MAEVNKILFALELADISKEIAPRVALMRLQRFERLERFERF